MTGRWERLGVEWGWPYSDDTVWHARIVDAESTLCGSPVDLVRPRPSQCRYGFFPVAQPHDPQPRHPVCDKAVQALAAPQPTVEAVTAMCPACGEQAPVDGGRIGAHGGGCVGANMPAQEGS